MEVGEVHRVVVDDAAVTPKFVEGVDPKRELPIIKRIAIGSLRNKLLFILPIALVLSEFAGAAVELHEAYLCNPFDLESVKDAIMAATEPEPTRMRHMHDWVMEHDVTAWAQSFLEQL